MGLRERTPSFVRKLHLRRFPAVFCKHPRAGRCHRLTHRIRSVQGVRHQRVSRNTQRVVYVLNCRQKTSVNGCDMARLGLQCPGLVPAATGDGPATRSELWLRKLLRGASGPAACRGEKPWQAFSQRLARASPAALVAHTLCLRDSHENLPSITPSRIRKQNYGSLCYLAALLLVYPVFSFLSLQAPFHIVVSCCSFCSFLQGSLQKEEGHNHRRG